MILLNARRVLKEEANAVGPDVRDNAARNEACALAGQPHEEVSMHAHGDVPPTVH